MTGNTDEDDILYPNYGPLPSFVSDEQAKVNFGAAVAEYLRENLSIELHAETGYYDSDRHTVTVTLMLAGAVLAKDYVDV